MTRTGTYYVVEKHIRDDEWQALPIEQSVRKAAELRVARLAKMRPEGRFRVGVRGEPEKPLDLSDLLSGRPK